ncbi:uncharacterized protein LOC117483755 [Trematomus bernacchii]|uniref:uncharacterized protein LOC117483755 n=1 Tax=Trematomus bernacchii TaxID=40690 RepID=UPI00146B69DE|nr:uncharacterized protein LOC117483755 [Trematomus bernacchii]
MMDQRRQSTSSTVGNSSVSVDEELQRAFRRGSGASGSGGGASLGANLNQVLQPRYQTQQYFGGWTSKSRKRTTGTVQNHPTFTKDVILLPHPEWDAVCKHKTKRRLHQKGFILNAFEMKKIWDCRTVIAELREAFKDNIPEGVSIELLMPCGNKLVSPKLREGQELNGFLIHKVFKSKAVYIRPSSMLQNTVSECSSLNDLLHTTEPLQDFLANAGCLRPLKSIEDRDLLVQDITMFQVVHRVAGAFERFKEGLKVLGVLDAIQMHPESFRPLMCHEPSALTADVMDHLFHILLSEVGSNKRRTEEVVVPFWRDYLQDVEDQEGPPKLGKILAFATGASVIPPVGFSPQPSIDFLHGHPSSPKQRLPMANTCINCLKLPLLETYDDFKECMDFALGNTQGFGRE